MKGFKNRIGSLRDNIMEMRDHGQTERKQRLVSILNRNLIYASVKHGGASSSKICRFLEIPNKPTLATTKQISGLNSRVVDFIRGGCRGL